MPATPPEDRLESAISGYAIHRYETLRAFLDDRETARLDAGPNGTKITLAGIYELVGHNGAWHLARFKSVARRQTVMVENDLLLLGDEQHREIIWNPVLTSDDNGATLKLVDYQDTTKRRRQREQATKNIIEALTS